MNLCSRKIPHRARRWPQTVDDVFMPFAYGRLDGRPDQTGYDPAESTFAASNSTRCGRVKCVPYFFLPFISHLTTVRSGVPTVPLVCECVCVCVPDLMGNYGRHLMRSLLCFRHKLFHLFPTFRENRERKNNTYAFSFSLVHTHAQFSIRVRLWQRGCGHER